MLVSLLLPMATPPARAQMIDPSDLQEFFGEEIKNPTQIIVLDLMDRSGGNTGMLGRTFSDALAIELTNTSTFEVIKRSEVERVMEEFSMAVPLGSAAQGMLADRLKCSYVLSGDINSVDIVRGREGTYAEVMVSVLVIHKVTQLPINGAQVVVRSSPKIGYSGNNDVLIHEALAIAAYQVTQKLLNNRLPIATVLNTPTEGQIILRGGSQLGFRKGMILTTVRRGQVTGRAKVTVINPSDSRGEVLEDSKGIAPGDKAVPIFEFAYSDIRTKEIKDRAGLHIAALGMLAGLAVLVGTDNGNKKMQNSPPVATVTAMADADLMGDSDGANLVSWPWQGARVIAYIIYRDTNPYAPVAVVDGHTTNWRDSCLPLPEIGSVMESTTVNVSLEQQTGVVSEFSYDTAFDTTLELQNNDEMTIDAATFTVTTRRVPLVPGQKVGYRVRLLYMDYEDLGLGGTGDFPENYSLFLGNIGKTSVRVTATKPPVLFQPAENSLPTDGIYRCGRVPMAMNYVLQIAINPTFEAKYRLPLRGVVPHIEGDDYVAATFLPAKLFEEVVEVQQRVGIPPSTENTPIYWRMGARVAGEVYPKAFADPNYNDWVFSRMRVFVLPPVPPSPMLRGVLTGRPGLPKLPVAPGGRSRLFERGR